MTSKKHTKMSRRSDAFPSFLSHLQKRQPCFLSAHKKFCKSSQWYHSRLSCIPSIHFHFLPKVLFSPYSKSINVPPLHATCLPIPNSIADPIPYPTSTQSQVVPREDGAEEHDETIRRRQTHSSQSWKRIQVKQHKR